MIITMTIESEGWLAKVALGWRALRYAAGHVESLKRVSDLRAEVLIAEGILEKARRRGKLEVVESGGFLTWNWVAYFRVPGFLGLDGPAVGWKMSKKVEESGRRFYYFEAFCVCRGSLYRVKIECDGDGGQTVGEGVRVYGGVDGGALEPAFPREDGDLARGEWRLVDTVARGFLDEARKRWEE